MERSATATPLTVRIAPDTTYRIAFEPLEDAPALLEAAGLRPGRCILVTDENVLAFHGERLERALSDNGWRPTRIVVPPGEASKSYDVLAQIYDQALAVGLDRRTPLFALGGGVVGDLAGFAAATLLRGIPLVHFATTLIAQVDSAIGGKTGINHALGKNLIGAFHQPQLVVSDPSTLETLSNREWTSGLAEVVKHGLISDESLFAYLEENWSAIMDRDAEIIYDMVPRAAGVKTAVVQLDERESGPRAHLNFGHTFGHAIEKIAGYGVFTHGEAVAVGMAVALHLSASRTATLDLERALELIQRLPVSGGFRSLDFDRLVATMKVDKKSERGRIRFVLLRRIGTAYIVADVPEREMEDAWNEVRRTAAWS